MNDLLKLEGKFEQKASSSQPRGARLPNGKHVDSAHIQELAKELVSLYKFWSQETLIKGALVSVQYPGVIAKSNRLQRCFAYGSIQANDSIVGARFQKTKDNHLKHILTHFVNLSVLAESKNWLTETAKIVQDQFNGCITSIDIDTLSKKDAKFTNPVLSKSKFIELVVDAFHVEKFFLAKQTEVITNNAIITIYKTGIATDDLMNILGITLLPVNQWDDTTMLLTPDQFKVLQERAPYLVAMSTSDISKLCKDDFHLQTGSVINIPDPQNEPVIGVIDTLFDKQVYFSKWVDYHQMIDHNVPTTRDDYYHGTAVTSIIVDGPSFNPRLDDGCGRFRVRHFGVTLGSRFSSFSILQTIKKIVRENRDIKVWNLSLGSMLEINPNFVSPEAAILDSIQYENDIIFVIAGTNKIQDDGQKMKIGAPADSINSLVVNAVNAQGKPAWYSRYGGVLSFFNKPDISYFGGEKNDCVRVCTPEGAADVSGTSFAAPWISRKMAYLIQVMGLSRETAKALIIDAAAGWSPDVDSPQLVGYGVVPTRIENIMQTKDDEIKFVIAGISEKYDTYNYNLPIPMHKEKYPFIARATLCYFPYCSRNQGVDYTSTELDIYFGRIKDTSILSINDNKQSIDKINYITEEEARKYYRKWDNVKHINETLKGRSKPKKAYANKMWGLSIKTKERVKTKYGQDIKFGIVITLKELKGINRIEDFIQQCSFAGWMVKRINVENRLDIYTIAETEVEFDE